MLNVEFEWFDPQPDVDFHGLKTLLRQLFDADNQLFDLSALTDLILEQPLLGSTVKVDGNETDPYAFLTVLNLHEHRVCPPKHSADGSTAKQLFRASRSSRISPPTSTRRLLRTRVYRSSPTFSPHQAHHRLVLY